MQRLYPASSVAEQMTEPTSWPIQTANNLPVMSTNQTTNNFVWPVTPSRVTNTMTTVVFNPPTNLEPTAASNAATNTDYNARSNRKRSRPRRPRNEASTAASAAASTSASNRSTSSGSRRARNASYARVSNTVAATTNNRSENTLASPRTNGMRTMIEQLRVVPRPCCAMNRPEVKVEQRPSPLLPPVNRNSPGLPHLPVDNPELNGLPFGTDTAQNTDPDQRSNLPATNQLPLHAVNNQFANQPVLNLNSTPLPQYPVENLLMYHPEQYLLYPPAPWVAYLAPQALALHHLLLSFPAQHLFRYEITRHTSRAAQYSHLVNPYVLPWSNPSHRNNVRRVPGSFACQHCDGTSTLGCPLSHNDNRPTNFCIYICDINGEPLHVTYCWLINLFKSFPGFRDVHILPSIRGAIVGFDTDYNTQLVHISLNGFMITNQFMLRLKLVYSRIYSYIYHPSFDPEDFVVHL